jgi:hypothetical protein
MISSQAVLVGLKKKKRPLYWARRRVLTASAFAIVVGSFDDSEMRPRFSVPMVNSRSNMAAQCDGKGQVEGLPI